MSVRRFAGVLLLLLGAGSLIAPQANLGLPALRWMSRYAFPGQALVGIVVLIAAYTLLGPEAES